MVEAEDRKTLVPFNLSHILDQVPELKKLDVKLDSASFEKPIDSSDMQPKHWLQMARIIEENYLKYDGFVILHGSDTLAYSASALSFMLDGMRKPVILTGSQLPIGMIRTDARENLITAVEMAAATKTGWRNPSVTRSGRLSLKTCSIGEIEPQKLSAEAFEAFFARRTIRYSRMPLGFSIEVSTYARTVSTRGESELRLMNVHHNLTMHLSRVLTSVSRYVA